MRKVATTITAQSGIKKDILFPTNGRNIIDNLVQSGVYTFVYRLGNSQASVSGMYENHTDYYKSLLVRDLSRKNRMNEYVQMCIPTENIKEIHEGVVTL